MTEISRVALFGKLNKLGYQAVEGATVFCKMRGNPYVEVVHWFHQILNGQDSDVHRIIEHYDLDPGKIAAEMTRALDAAAAWGQHDFRSVGSSHGCDGTGLGLGFVAVQFKSGAHRAPAAWHAQNTGVAQHPENHVTRIGPDRRG